MLTYDEILEQALQLTAAEQQTLIVALENALEQQPEALTPLARLALAARKTPISGKPNTEFQRISDIADEVVNELMRRHLIDHAEHNAD